MQDGTEFGVKDLNIKNTYINRGILHEPHYHLDPKRKPC